MKIAIIGAGISGLSAAHFLNGRHDVTVFEKEDRAGGLIKCLKVDGNLFHTCGGHVFNSKRKDVLDWFWSKFSREEEFVMTTRNSCVYFESTIGERGMMVPYPIENHIYHFDQEIQKAFYEDLEEIDKSKGTNTKFTDYKSFGDFLRWRFGKTLYDLYFEPYNRKVWRRDLSTVPMSWMEGKLPMPTTQEMRDNNALHVEEKQFVHSTFWYEKENGSQFIADKLAEGLNIVYNCDISSIELKADKWLVFERLFDKVIFCGNLKELPNMLKGLDISKHNTDIANLEYHGTTSVFCEIDKIPYSWIYQPSCSHESHRIICTGNFAESNNRNLPEGRITATIEFTDFISKENIIDNLKRIPFSPKYLDHVYNQYTYPIQDANTRSMIKALKLELAPMGFFITGRFADWEYYNMDVAIGAAKDLCSQL